MFCAANIVNEQEVIVTAIMIALFIFTLFSCTPTNFQSNRVAKTPTTSETDLLQNLGVYKNWIRLSSITRVANLRIHLINLNAGIFQRVWIVCHLTLLTMTAAAFLYTSF